MIYYLKVFLCLTRVQEHSPPLDYLALEHVSLTKLLFFLTLYAVFKVLNSKISLDALASLETLAETREKRIFSRFNHSSYRPRSFRRREILLSFQLLVKALF